jgi:hypothetical protein
MIGEQKLRKVILWVAFQAGSQKAYALSLGVHPAGRAEKPGLPGRGEEKRRSALKLHHGFDAKLVYQVPG